MLESRQDYTFGQLFKLFRLKSGFRSLPCFIDTMCAVGICLSPSELSRWQSDKRVPKDRTTVLKLIEALAVAGGIEFIDDANRLLAAADHGYLTDQELAHLLMVTPIQIESEQLRGINRERLADYRLQIKLNLTLSRHLEDYLTQVSHQYHQTKAAIIRQMIDQNMKLSNEV